jgi:hypothetical protein
VSEIKIIELSDKVVVIQGVTLLNDNGKKHYEEIFKRRGFKVIWVEL